MEHLLKQYNTLDEKKKYKFCVYLAIMSRIFVAKYEKELDFYYLKLLQEIFHKEPQTVFILESGKLQNYLKEHENLDEYTLNYLAKKRYREYLVYNAIAILNGIFYYKTNCFGIYGFEEIAKLLDERLYIVSLKDGLTLNEMIQRITQKEVFILIDNTLSLILDNMGDDVHCEKIIQDYLLKMATILEKI